MKSVAWATAVTLLVLSGCNSETDVWTEQSGDIDTAIQIDIAVRSRPYESGDAINKGDFFVVSSNVIPIQSNGGAGYVVSHNEGITIALQWDAVRLHQSRINQHHSPDTQISFDNLRFDIKNQLVRPDGVTHQLASGPDSLNLGSTFDAMLSPLTFTSDGDDKERSLVIRARLLPESPPAIPLHIPVERAG